jgi:hypothetical protein
MVPGWVALITATALMMMLIAFQLRPLQLGPSTSST